jgi:phage/plasmid primase-like uncharacterized protein
LQREAAAREAQLRLSEHARSLAYWQRLEANHANGAEYLSRRGLGDARDLVRYDRRHGGAPSLPLYASDGRVKNVVRRPLEPGEKPLGLYGCTTPGTLVDPVSGVSGRSPEVVITEGFADSLTAKVAYAHLGAHVFGAHGAGNLEKITRVVASRVAELDGRLRICPHKDKAGFERSLEAAQLAISAGLSVRRGSLVIVTTGAQDLNDAWCAGWRPAA